MKICLRCRRQKDADEFHLTCRHKDGHSPYCKICVAECGKKYRRTHADQIRIRNRLYMRKVSIRPEVRMRLRATDRKYYIKKKSHPAGIEALRKKARDIYHRNPEIMKAYQREYRQNHKEEIRNRQKKYMRHRRFSDLNYHILSMLRASIRNAIYRIGVAKSNRSMALLGCDLAKFKKHIENLFLPGMDWRNFGAWHLDHVVPCAAFDLTDKNEQAICFHFTNLQPLWAKDNRRKADTFMGHKIRSMFRKQNLRGMANYTNTPNPPM